MENLATYLILSGYLTPGESLMLQKVLSQATNYIQAKSYLKKSGFTNFDKIISNLTSKCLIKIIDNMIIPDWKELRTFARTIEKNLVDISHDLHELKKLTDESKNLITTATTSRSSIKDLLLRLPGNKQSISENQLLQDDSLVDDIGPIEWLEEFNIIKIKKHKRSRTITPTAEGAALRYIFSNKDKFNKANFNYLEALFLGSHSETWESFLEKINNEKEKQNLSERFLFLSRLFVELGVLSLEEEELFKLEKPQFESPVSKPSLLRESISGFVPASVSNLYDALRAINDNNQATSKIIQQDTGLGSTAISGILRMLQRFKCVKEEKEKVWTPTKLGKKLLELPFEEFIGSLREKIENYPIFTAVIDFISKSPDNKAGFMDVVGYFRSNGVLNFNPAKSITILRILTQLGLKIEEDPEKSGIYQLIRK